MNLLQILEDIKHVKEIIIEKKLFHTLSMQSDDLVFKNRDMILSDEEKNKYLDLIEKNVKNLKNIINEKNFKNEWVKLSGVEKFLLMNHHEKSYSILREVLSVDEITFISMADFDEKLIFHKEFFALIGVDCERMPLNAEEEVDFFQKLNKTFKIKQAEFEHIKVNRYNHLNKYMLIKMEVFETRLPMYQIGLLMAKRNAIRGAAFLIWRYIQRKEEYLSLKF